MALPSDAAQSNGDVVRRLDELERALQELAAARRMESATIGSGGIRVRGGAITVQTPDGLTDLAVLSSAGIFFNGQPLLLPGSVSYFAGPAGSIPGGWLVCDGTAVSRTTYAQLFATIGIAWGAGNGTTTFNLPDLRDRVPVGAGSSYAVGATGGSATHAHASATGNAGSHGHTQAGTGSGGSHSHGIGAGTDAIGFVTLGGPTALSAQAHTHGGTGGAGTHSHSTSSVDAVGDHAHGIGADSSLPPYGAVLAIIRT